MICSTCSDTHRMELDGRAVPCTRCPTPCRDCAGLRGTGPYCSETPCKCECHRDPAERLGAILREIGARPTIDVQRSTRRGCYICGTEDRPRELVVIGIYTRRMGGNIQPGDKIIRPLCRRCEEMTR